MKQNKNLTLRVYNRMKQMLLEHAFPPRHRLCYASLAQRLGVSCTPVIDALKMLHHEGYINTAPKRGFYVPTPSTEEIDDLLAFKEILEFGSIEKAIRKRTIRRLSLLRLKKEAYERSLFSKSRRKRYLLDIDFHTFIVGMTGNPLIVSQYREICRRIHVHAPISHLAGKDKSIMIEEHQRLYDAVRFKDVEMAKKVLKEHPCSHKNRRASNSSELHPSSPLKGSRHEKERPGNAVHTVTGFPRYCQWDRGL